MDMPLTLGLAAAALAIALFAGWRGAIRWHPGMPIRMIPWRFIMVLAAAAIMILLIHAGALLGLPQRTR